MSTNDIPSPANPSPGDVHRGVAQEVTDFGAFISFQGCVGLVTVPNLAWTRIDSPRDVISPGDDVTVVVLAVDEARSRISLSIKDLQPDPLLEFATQFLGEEISGKVTKVAPIGIFLRVHPGLEGLLPAEELHQMQTDWRDLRSGTAMDVKVSAINVQLRRIALSLTKREN
ncbi:S1 RNA-binding domain-containing protein [Streptomyces chumphonensis]|uniref:S1 RNA-binding domain-containing protein n=1 Tax=Streptomyces chumphonensis TaxID=1214925 RepID=A0A927EWF8_9ACTN|nr:S1 RNA-binding domain-containing protein [Streptomyces chumphonensis]MBD3929977.1 S1 RNA-binding domain-containing protein [Streptomyces chumphonensis]